MAHSDSHRHASGRGNAQGLPGVNNKLITYIGIAVIIVLGAFIGYKYLVANPNTKKADDAVFHTQKSFEELVNFSGDDSAKAIIAAKVLNGDGSSDGALKIISRYKGTPAANLCEYYAGASYLRLGQFDKALDHLKKFKANGATQIQSRQYGMMGDAYSELKKNKEALNYYKKAAEVNTKDDFTSSEFLFRAAVFALNNGNSDEAIQLFKELKTKYPSTDKAGNADKYLANLGIFSE